jgi:hypothetical protein
MEAGDSGTCCVFLGDDGFFCAAVEELFFFFGFAGDVCDCAGASFLVLLFRGDEGAEEGEGGASAVFATLSFDVMTSGRVLVPAEVLGGKKVFASFATDECVS